jgi:ferritin-like metal-binding protein YciE
MPNTSVAPDNHFLKAIFNHHLNRIYNGKCFLRNGLDHLISLASFKGLQLAMEEFGNDLKNQIARMEEIYKLINEKPVDLNCNPITNIIKDEFCLDENQTMSILNDLDIILYVQLLEHVNITSYRMLIMIAKNLKYDDAKQLLIENFDESADNDKLFLLIAKEYITSD